MSNVTIFKVKHHGPNCRKASTSGPLPIQAHHTPAHRQVGVGPGGRVGAGAGAGVGVGVGVRVRVGSWCWDRARSRERERSRRSNREEFSPPLDTIDQLPHYLHMGGVITKF